MWLNGSEGNNAGTGAGRTEAKNLTEKRARGNPVGLTEFTTDSVLNGYRYSPAAASSQFSIFNCQLTIDNCFPLPHGAAAQYDRGCLISDPIVPYVPDSSCFFCAACD